MKNATIIRHRQSENYTQIPNALLSDPELSWKAKGILCYLLSKPSDWFPRVSDIQNNSTDGSTSIYNGLIELRKAGYAQLQKITEAGKVMQWQLVIADRVEFEKTNDIAVLEKPELENPNLDFQVHTNTEETKTESTKTEKKALPEIPPELDTAEFREAFAEWAIHKKERRAPLTPLSVKKLFNHLASIGSSRAVAAINHSIAKGYLGVYEPQHAIAPQPRKDVAW